MQKLSLPKIKLVIVNTVSGTGAELEGVIIYSGAALVVSALLARSQGLGYDINFI